MSLDMLGLSVCNSIIILTKFTFEENEEVSALHEKIIIDKESCLGDFICDMMASYIYI
jgi:hypothetical protein